MTTAKEATLTEIRDILLRIERILTREADNATVDYYVRRLSQPRPVPLPDQPRTGDPSLFHTYWDRVRTGSPLPGMPDPPIAPVPTWGSAQTSSGTAHLSGGVSAVEVEKLLGDPRECVVIRQAPTAPRTWMHGGWIHRDGFSMVGP